MVMMMMGTAPDMEGIGYSNKPRSPRAKQPLHKTVDSIAIFFYFPFTLVNSPTQLTLIFSSFYSLIIGLPEADKS